MMEEIIRDLLDNKGIFGVLVIDKEGEIILSKCEEGIDDLMVSTMIADIAKEIAVQMKIRKNFTVIVLTERGKILISVRRDFLLVILAESGVDTDRFRLKLRQSVKAISRSL